MLGEKDDLSDFKTTIWEDNSNTCCKQSMQKSISDIDIESQWDYPYK